MDTCQLTITHEDFDGSRTTTECSDEAWLVHITTFDMRLEPTDGPATEVVVRTYCEKHSEWMRDSDGTDALLVSARYNRIIPAYLD